MSIFRVFTRTYAFAAVLAPLALVGCGPAEEGEDEFEDDGIEAESFDDCGDKCDSAATTYKSPYVMDFAKVKALFPGPDVKKADDVWSVTVKLGTKTVVAPTHMFGTPVNVIPYSDTDGAKDAAGKTLARGDEVIARIFPPGQVGIVLKNHRPQYRLLDTAALGADSKEHMKLQDTHIGIVVGVTRNGKNGAITLNNPQTYQSGLFGDDHYPMVFLRPSWPTWLKAAQRTQFNDNLRTMVMGFNAVTNFPGDYNGGDPLYARDAAKVQESVKNMVKAITGDATAKAWFQKPETLVYCAELAHLSTSAALMFPLNDKTMNPLVGAATWTKFKAEVTKHNAGQASAFSTLNRNEKAKLVKLQLAPETMKAAWEYAPASAQAANKAKLAFQPMTMADIVEHFLRLHVPRETLGESVAPAQAALLQAMKPGMLENMGMDKLAASDPKRQAVEALFGQLVTTVGKSYASYAKFREAVAPLLAQARQMTGPRDDSGAGLFVPPSMFHVVAQGKNPGGMLGLRYVGHGIHVSAAKKK